MRNFNLDVSNIINSLTIDLSRTYQVQVKNTNKPVLQFRNEAGGAIDVNSYNLDYPRTQKFNLLNNLNNDIDSNIKYFNTVSFQNFLSTIGEIDKTPLIVYDNSDIYHVSLSYEIISIINDLSVNIDYIDHEISLNDLTYGESIDISYYGFNIHGISSDPITLKLNFKDIPNITICGDIIQNIQYNVDTSYIDPGFILDSTFIDTSNIIFIEPSNNSILSSLYTNYDISYSTDLCLNKIGIYDLSYIVSLSNSSDTTFFIRRLHVKDTRKPFITIPDFSNIYLIDASNGLINDDSSYNSISGDLLEYSIDNSNITIDFSLSVLSNFQDLSFIIHNFDTSDNHEGIINKKIDLKIQGLNGSNISFDFDLSGLIELTNNNYINSDNSFIVVTKNGINTKSPLVFTYNITDPCDNVFSFNRTVHIVDLTKPYIIFNAINNSFLSTYTDYSFVKFDTSNIDFSFEAFNYSISNEQFINEISNILFNFDICDNLNSSNEISNNFVITISNAAYDVSNIHNISDISNDDSIKNLFKNYDTSFQLIYDFSDNQYNNNSIIRNVNIINSIDPSININTESSYNYVISVNNNIITLDISFGDLSSMYYLENNIINIHHPRLKSTDISFDISYTLPSTLNSILGISYEDNSGNNYDPSALIYSYTSYLNDISYDISFYTISESSFITLSSEIISLNINVNNYGPKLLNNVPTISHPAGIAISDASLIFDIHFYSIFDEFYYYNYSDISYTETLFTISAESSFNQILPIPGQYTLVYESNDQNNISVSFERIITVTDSSPPIITLLGNEYDIIQQYSTTYIDPGITIIDEHSNISSIIINIYKYDISNGVIESSLNILTLSGYNDTSYNDYINTNISFIDTTKNTSIDNIYYKIEYIAYDIYNNGFDISKTRIIDICNAETLFVKPYILYDSSKNYLEDTSFTIPNDETKFLLKYNASTNTIIYEASTNPILYDSSLTPFCYGIDASFSSVISNDDINKYVLTYEHNTNDLSNVNYQSVNNYKIIFQADYYDIVNNELYVEKKEYNLQIEDNTSPNISFKNNISDIELPLLDVSTINYLSNNINYFNDSINFLNYQGNIMYDIPGIHVDDIVDGTAISLSNEILNINNGLRLDVSYAINEGTGTNIYGLSYELSNNDLINSSSAKNYIQKYTITDACGNSNDILRNITIKRFEPYINIYYNNGEDNSGNKYKKTYHILYSKYIDAQAEAYDYYDGEKTNDITSNITEFREDISGSQTIIYTVINTNNQSKSAIREIDVIELNCLSFDNNNFQTLYNYTDTSYTKLGVYGTPDNSFNYKFNIPESSNKAIKIIGYNEDLESNKYFDISNTIYINSINDLSFIDTEDGSKYYYGNFDIVVINNFYRASLEYIDISNGSKAYIHDLFIYSETCENVRLQNINNINKYELIVDVSKNNNNYNNYKSRFFTISGETFDSTKRKTLYLGFGKYKFKQNSVNNFYNRIKFSTIPDGYHHDSKDLSNTTYELIQDETGDYNHYKDFLLVNDNSFNFSNKNDFSYNQYAYTKNVFWNNKLAGTSDSYTEIIIDNTTPSPLYYFSDNFPHMGGKIYVKNNIVIQNNHISLIGNVISNNHSNIYDSNYGNIDFSNTIILGGQIDVSSNYNEFKQKNNIIGINQKNLNHNIVISNKNKNKIVFRKYSNNNENKYTSIKQNNNNKYLLDVSTNNIRSNLLLYDFEYVDQNNFLTYNNNMNYDLNLYNLVYNNKEYQNYYNFYYKNNLQNSEIFSNNFKFVLNEMASINNVDIIDVNTIYKPFEKVEFRGNRLTLQPFNDNLVNLNLRSYLDFSGLIDNNISYLINNNFNKNNANIYYDENINFFPLKDLCYNYLFFQDFHINILNDISFASGVTESLISNIVIFDKNTILLNAPLLDSSNNQTTLTECFKDVSNGDVYNVLKDRVVLSLNNSNENATGLTQQNIYHNMFVDESNNIIFHEYNNNTVNYQVNYNLSVEKTLSEDNNNKLYFLEVSNNDVYNFLNNENRNIYEAGKYTNKYIDISSLYFDSSYVEYNIHNIYNTLDEIDVNTEILNTMDIRATSLNDVCYNLYGNNSYINSSNSSNSNLNNDSLHSNSFIIDLLNYINRELYNNININKVIHFSNIDYNNLKFIVTDISYTKADFNLIDVGSKINIIYDKSKIQILNNLESLIHITNFKLNYLAQLTKIYYSNANNIDNFINSNDYTFINTLNLHSTRELYNNEDNISFDNYIFELGNNTLNQLYYTVFYNSKQLLSKYNVFFALTSLFDYQLDICANIYSNIKDFVLVEKVLNDVNSMNSNIDNQVFNIYIRGNTILLNNSIEFTNLPIQSYLNFNKLKDSLIDYYDLKNEYDKTVYELELRHDYYYINTGANITISNESYIYYNNYRLTQSSEYKNIYNNYDIYSFYEHLINNYIQLNNNILEDFSKNHFVFNISGEELDSYSIQISNSTSFLNEVSNNQAVNYFDNSFIVDVSNIKGNLELYKEKINEKYDISKGNIFNPINYIVNGSEILVNSIKSNNIAIKFDLVYNSFLYRNTYLDTFVLDMTIPDIIPPTIIFNTSYLTINYSTIESDISNLITTLINDISYIDINEQQIDLTLNNTSYTYNNLVSNSITDISQIDVSFSLIEIDLSGVFGYSNGAKTIVYTIRDNANNKNIINREVNFIYDAIKVAEFYLLEINNGSITEILLNGHNSNIDNYPLNILENDNNNIIISKAKNNIVIKEYIDRTGNSFIEGNKNNNFNNKLSIDISNNFAIYTYIYDDINKVSRTITLTRPINITETDIEIGKEKVHCCFPKVYYKPIQHNYKLGASNSTAMRLAKFIINS